MPTRPTFNWQPEYESQLSQEPTVKVTAFGDGYEQRTPIGINNARQKWNLRFTSTNETYPEVLAFVQARGAVESFAWTTPLGQAGVYVCRSWKMTRSRGYNTIDLTFEQVFEA